MPRLLWNYTRIAYPCPMCSEPPSLNGRHLLQCPALPANLLEARAKLLEEHYPDLNLVGFAQRVVECFGAHLHNDERNYSTDSWLQSLALGRKIARFAKSTLNRKARLLSERELADLFAPASEELPAVRYPIVGGQLSSLGVITMAIAMGHRRLASKQVEVENLIYYDAQIPVRCFLPYFPVTS